MRYQRRTICLWLVAGTAAALGGCGGGGDSLPPVLQVDAAGTSTIDSEALTTLLDSYPMMALSAAETESLLYMRQEEQLAHDVFTVSAGLYAPPVFTNVADSEATHAQAIKTLLDRYGLADPLAGLPEGRFASTAIQALYDDFEARSRTGLIEALKVGLEIEELDIRDLAAQRATIDNADILMVYDHLARGSRNHLRAFMKVLTAQGGTYTPLYLTQAQFDAIVSSPVETGA